VDAKTFNMVDGMLARQGFHDARESASSLMEVGVREGTLGNIAEVIAGRYALQAQVVVEWYSEVLKRRIEAAQEISDKLKALGESNVGSQ